MNILMIIDRYHPIWGGAENQLRQLIPHIKPHGHDVKVLTRRWHHDLKPFEHIDGTPVHRVGLPGRSPISTASYILGVTRYIQKNRNRIDVIHTHGAARLGSAGRFWGKMFHKAVAAKIATAGKIPNLTTSFFGRRCLSYLKTADAVICLNDEIHRELNAIRFPSKNMFTIPNGVDTQRFFNESRKSREAWRESRGWRSRDPVCLFSGRFVPRKGVDVVLRIWAEMLRAFPQARLILLGSGRDQPDSIERDVREAIAKESLAHVYFETQSNTPEEFYNMADVLFFPSRKEGMPNTLLEAMAAGLIPVAFDIPGVNDIIKNNKNGFLCPLNDIGAFKEAARKTIGTLPGLTRMREANRALCKERYSFQHVSRQYHELYNKIARPEDKNEHP
jgi:glycosyltransferase involved in cell wall biosynthesis